mmetsp:Transcript_99/g.130  ORF Transcript_99/g.130 Transcript_99/m.130 type:complete len:408 (+) Transcript_99:271-1494(+)
MVSISRNITKKTTFSLAFLTGTVFALIWFSFASTVFTSGKHSRSIEIDSKTDMEDALVKMVGGLEKDFVDTKTTLSTLEKNMENVQSQLLNLTSLVKDVVLNSKIDSERNNNKLHQDLQSVVKNIEGDGWKIADFEKDDSNPHDFDCEMVDFKVSNGSKTGYQICVHPFQDIISDVIRRNGNWGDCHILSQFWKEESKDKGDVYVDIGANIGSCIMEMLFSTDANIVAFEPNPKNLYPLKNTLRKLPKHYQDRVALFPVALGSTKSSSTIFSASNNMGNSHVGKAVADLDLGHQVFHDKDTFEIRVERLDSILNTGTKITLMKLDAQGFECEVLDGMGSDLAATVQHVHFEKADRFLKEHGCYDLVTRFRNLGFSIYNGHMLIPPEKDKYNNEYNLDARRNKSGLRQ